MIHPLRLLEHAAHALDAEEHRRNVLLHQHLVHAQAHPGPLHAYMPNELLATMLDALRNPALLPLRPGPRSADAALRQHLEGRWGRR